MMLMMMLVSPLLRQTSRVPSHSISTVEKQHH